MTGAVVVPISLATTFAQPSPGEAPGKATPLSYGRGFEYSRTGNPTRAAFETAVAASEGAKHGIAFASGLAATVTVLHLLPGGAAVTCIDDVYGGTQRYFRRIATPTYGMTFTFADLSGDPAADASVAAAIDAAIKPGTTRMVWLETPTNPTLKVADIAAVAKVATAAGAITVVDNTFASPYHQSPLELGATIVVHSVTKYLNGHSDVVGGVVLTNDDEIATKLRFLQNSLGGVPAPMDCYLALRGLKTLHLRMERHASNAAALAAWLEGVWQPAGVLSRVLYPGLASHPHHAVAARQMKRGFGGMVTLVLAGGGGAARAFLQTVKVRDDVCAMGCVPCASHVLVLAAPSQLFTCAESLGAVESLAESPAIMTHASVPPEVRAELGISDGLVRLSVGVEDLEDLRADLLRALKAAAELTPGAKVPEVGAAGAGK